MARTLKPKRSSPNWSVGDEFTTGDGRRFRIVGIVGVPDDVGIYNAFWKVESASD